VAVTVSTRSSAVARLLTDDAHVLHYINASSLVAPIKISKQDIHR